MHKDCVTSVVLDAAGVGARRKQVASRLASNEVAMACRPAVAVCAMLVSPSLPCLGLMIQCTDASDVWSDKRVGLA